MAAGSPGRRLTAHRAPHRWHPQTRGRKGAVLWSNHARMCPETSRAPRPRTWTLIKGTPADPLSTIIVYRGRRSFRIHVRGVGFVSLTKPRHSRSHTEPVNSHTRAGSNASRENVRPAGAVSHVLTSHTGRPLQDSTTTRGLATCHTSPHRRRLPAPRLQKTCGLLCGRVPSKS